MVVEPTVAHAKLRLREDAMAADSESNNNDDLVEKVYRVLDRTGNRELRTPRGIAAVLKVDEKDVVTALYVLETQGRIKGEPRRDGLETWVTKNTPPPPDYQRKRR